MQPIIECVPNFSEGNDLNIIKQITDEIESVEGVRLLNVDPGKATNRTVVTFVGNPKAVMEAAFLAIKKAADSGMGVFAMKAFGGGNLTEHYMEALDYVYNLDGIESTMIGFGDKKEVDDIINYLDGKLDYNYIPDIKHKKINIDQGDCEACYACIEKCPNHAIFINEKGLAQVDHEKCLTCGYCAPVCPVRAIIMF